MAILSRGIVQGQMAWPLIIAGMLMGTAFILMQVKSPMLVSVGMYLPIETTFAIFVGGLIKGAVDMFTEKRKYNDAQKVRVENTGVLLASGLIAGKHSWDWRLRSSRYSTSSSITTSTSSKNQLSISVLLFGDYSLCSNSDTAQECR